MLLWTCKQTICFSWTSANMASNFFWCYNWVKFWFVHSTGQMSENDVGPGKVTKAAVARRLRLLTVGDPSVGYTWKQTGRILLRVQFTAAIVPIWSPQKAQQSQSNQLQQASSVVRDRNSKFLGNKLWPFNLVRFTGRLPPNIWVRGVREVRFYTISSSLRNISRFGFTIVSPKNVKKQSTAAVWQCLPVRGKFGNLIQQLT